MGVVATLWYLIAVWTGSDTGHASDLYQPVAFLWFTAAVAALECGDVGLVPAPGAPRRRPGRVAPALLSAEYLAGLTGGIFFCHVLFLNLVRTALGDIGHHATPRVGRAGRADVRADHGVRGVCTALLLLTPLRWVLTGPVRAEQRARLGVELPRAMSQLKTHRGARARTGTDRRASSQPALLA